MPGPPPKRSTERVRRNRVTPPDVVRLDGSPVDPPPASGSWHREARAWYRSLAQSGQARYYEPSDWRQAHVLAGILSTIVSSERPSSELVKAWLAGASELGVTEGARRRLRIEVERAPAPPDESDAKVAVMDRYRQAVGGGRR